MMPRLAAAASEWGSREKAGFVAFAAGKGRESKVPGREEAEETAPVDMSRRGDPVEGRPERLP